MTWKYAGRTGVDSGTILITDPCYVVRNPDEQKYQPFESWDTLVGGLPAAEPFQCTNQFGADIGVIVSGFGGDGVFPVFIDVAPDGRVRGAQIRFDGQAPR